MEQIIKMALVSSLPQIIAKDYGVIKAILVPKLIENIDSKAIFDRENLTLIYNNNIIYFSTFAKPRIVCSKAKAFLIHDYHLHKDKRKLLKSLEAKTCHFL